MALHRLMASHCIHEGQGYASGTRYCCWCDLTQTLEQAATAPLHGPRHPQRWTYFWSPSGTGECPRDAVEGVEVAGGILDVAPA